MFGYKWIFTIKYLPNGYIECAKACLVAKALEIYGIDYYNTFSPLARLNYVLIFISL